MRIQSTPNYKISGDNNGNNNKYSSITNNQVNFDGLIGKMVTLKTVEAALKAPDGMRWLNKKTGINSDAVEKAADKLEKTAVTVAKIVFDEIG